MALEHDGTLRGVGWDHLSVSICTGIAFFLCSPFCGIVVEKGDGAKEERRASTS